jgi:hypothetical protein
MPDSFRPLWRRAVLLMLLGLLLPVQNSLAYARSLAMLTASQSEGVIARESVNEMAPATEHHAHHHSSQDVDAVMAEESAYAHPHMSDEVKPCHSEAPVGNQGHDCAKCCLIGAAAPPPCLLHIQSLLVVRHCFMTSSHSLSGFIPDGLERPPRTPLA